MSSFICEKCGKEIIDTPKGYITGCEHYPMDGEKELVGTKTVLSELVEYLEKSHENVKNELGELRAAMLVNFGEEGRYKKGIVNKLMSTLQMFLVICDYFINESSVNVKPIPRASEEHKKDGWFCDPQWLSEMEGIIRKRHFYRVFRDNIDKLIIELEREGYVILK